MQITAFDPPANINDFSDPQRKTWSEFIAYHFDQNVKIITTELKNNGAPANLVPQFYDPLAATPKKEPDQIAKDIPWIGFPRVLSTRFGTSALDVSEELGIGVLGYDPAGNPVAFRFRKQDEYLEWHAERDPKTGKVTRLVFTCEAPEYWSALAMGSPSPYYSLMDDGTTFVPSTPPVSNLDAVVALYRIFLGNTAISKDDLVFASDIYNEAELKQKIFSKGDYNPWNKYNTTDGVVHLTQPNNTLGAEINLAARSTIRRKPGAMELTDNILLICCAAYGNGNRNSDPTIGGTVNTFARNDAFVTLLNPVGLYMTDFNGAALTTPDGTPASQFWQWVRPNSQVGDGFNRYLRAVFEVPSSKGYVVGDIKTSTNENIDYGGQLASLVTMMLVGVVDRIGQRHVDPIKCVAHGCRSVLNSGYVVILANGVDKAGNPVIAPCASMGDFTEINVGNAAPDAMRTSFAIARSAVIPKSITAGANKYRMSR